MVVLCFIKLGSVGNLSLKTSGSAMSGISYHYLTPLEVLLLDLIQNFMRNLFLFRRICKDCTSILSARS